MRIMGAKRCPMQWCYVNGEGLVTKATFFVANGGVETDKGLGTYPSLLKISQIERNSFTHERAHQS